MYDRLRVMEVNLSDLRHDYRTLQSSTAEEKEAHEERIRALRHDIANVKTQIALIAETAEKALRIAGGQSQEDAA
jgi:ribosomal protein L29